MTNKSDEIDIEHDPIGYLASLIPKQTSFKQQRAEIKAKQSGKSRAAIREQLAAETDEAGVKTFEEVFDPETAIAPEHNWVERGLVRSCEGANHPNHRHFLAKRR